MQTCKSAAKYKGTRPPKCNGGVGCEDCWAIWNAAGKPNAKSILEAAKAVSAKRYVPWESKLPADAQAVLADLMRNLGTQSWNGVKPHFFAAFPSLTPVGVSSWKEAFTRFKERARAQSK